MRAACGCASGRSEGERRRYPAAAAEARSSVSGERARHRRLWSGDRLRREVVARGGVGGAWVVHGGLRAPGRPNPGRAGAAGAASGAAGGAAEGVRVEADRRIFF